MASKLAIPEAVLEQHGAILAKTGAGKSYAARGFLEWLLDQGRRVCVIDPTGVHWGIRLKADGKKPSPYPVVIFGGDHADVPIGATSGGELGKLIATANLPCVIDVLHFGVGERQRFFTDLAHALMRHNRLPLQLFIDEAHEFMPQTGYGEKSPQRGAMINAGNRLVAGGRARGLRVMLISQRAAKVQKDSLTQIETLIAMKLIHKLDRNAVEDWVKACAEPEDWKRVEKSLAKLETGTGWVWAPALDVLEQIHFPKIRTFDSFRPAADEEEAQAAPAALADIDLEQLRSKLGETKGGKGETKRGRGETRKASDETARARIAELEKENRDLHQRLVASEREIGRLTRHMEQAARALTDAVAQGRRPPAQSNGTAHVDPDKEKTATRRLEDAGVIPRGASHPAKAAPVDGLTWPQQRLLDAMASLETLGLEVAPKATLAAFAGVKPTSGGFFNNLGRLRAMGLIGYPAGGQVALTDAGRAAAATPPPATLEDLHDHWLDVVTAPQARILRELINAYPDAVEKDALAERVGVSPTSGGYFNNLGRLRTLGAIEYPAPGTARAADILFPRT